MNMESIRVLAESVTDDHSAYVKAKMKKAEAEDTLLLELLRIVQPALPAICSKEVSGTGHSRAVRLPGNILLLEQGVFMQVHPGMRTLTTSEVLDKLSVVDIATVLAGALAAQVGKRTNITQTILREARTIEAIILALKMGGIK